jgi:hypothetical protein
MRVIPLLLAVSLAWLPGACSRDSAAERRREMLRAPEPAPVAAAVREPPLYDENGMLLPSDQAVAGLRLPRGLKLRRTLFRHWIYETGVPLEKLKIYFGPLLYGGSLQVAGKTTSYHSAKLRSDRTGLLRLDLRILPLLTDQDINLVDIREVPRPVRGDEPPLEAVRRQAARQRQFAH